MALVKTSSDIIYIKGRLGGVYFKRGSPNFHCQAMPRHVLYAPSTAQGRGISRWSAMSGIWMMVLLAAMGTLWAGFALAHLFWTREGEGKHITGYNWYMHYAMTFPETDQLPFWKPPHAPYELPDFLVNYMGMWSYEHHPDEWPFSSPQDYYWRSMDFHGKPSYRTDNLKWFLWWKAPNWIISEGLDFEAPLTTFYSPTPEIVGYYKNFITMKWCHVYPGRRD